VESGFPSENAMNEKSWSPHETNASHAESLHMRSFTIVLAAVFVGGCFTALAAEQSVFQKGKLFSERELSIKKGGTLLFVNDDNVAHNVMSTSPGNEFNLGSQLPGVSTPVTFNAVGEVDVICAIHPRMHVTVNVTN
jgi:plastocyanin